MKNDEYVDNDEWFPNEAEWTRPLKNPSPLMEKARQ
jgi:hypothetical protein